MRRPPISPSGLIRANQSAKPSWTTSLRKAARAAASIRSAMSRWLAAAAAFRSAIRTDDASSTAELTCSRCRLAITGWPYLAKMTSPCSVTLNDPLTEPGACASTARPGPPPRPSAPPRPWNRVSRTPWAAAHSASLAWVSNSRRVALAGPSSLAESEYPSIASSSPPLAATRSATSGSASMPVSTSGAWARSAALSNSGTTSSLGIGPPLGWRNGRARTPRRCHRPNG